MKTLQELLAGKTKTQIKTEIMEQLSLGGFSLTNFIPGASGLTLIEAESWTLEDVYKLIVEITKGGFIDYATGDWLDLAATFYNLTRKAPVFTEYDVTLSCAGGVGPYTIAAGGSWASTPAGRLYNNTTGGVLASGSTLTLRYKADESGSAFNVGNGAITRLITPLPGVTITASTLQVTGANLETDEDFRRRCKLRWAELGGGATRKAYEFWALSALSAVKQVRVLDQTENAGLGGGNGAQGTVDVILWGDGAALSGPDVTAVTAYIQERRPLTAQVFVYSAAELEVTLTATLTVRSGFKAAAELAVASNLEELRRSIPIGGKLYKASLYEALMQPAGMVNAVITVPAGDTDTQLDLNEALTLTPTLTWVEV